MKKLFTLLVALALFAVACGDDATTETGAGDDPPPNAEAPDDAVGATGADDDMAEADSDASDATQAHEPDDVDRVERIVSITPTGTEILYAIGAGDRVVAVDVFSYFPDEAPVTELDGWNPNVEAIASYEPDLVVMASNGDVQAALEALGITVIVQDGPADFDGVYAQFEELGAATGHIAEAAEIVLAMQTEIDELVADVSDAAGLTYYHELDNTLYSVTSTTFIGEVYSLFGLTNVADPADEEGAAFGYPQLSDEYLVDSDPDLIFLADTACCGQSAETVAARPGWSQLSAVVNANVVELDDDVASRWTRIVDFIRVIAEAVNSVEVPA